MGLFDKKYCDICGAKIGLLGGEPLLHPDFGYFCDRLRDDPRAHAVVVYTNGRLLHNHLHSMSAEKFALLVNCNEKAFYGEAEFAKLRDNIARSVEQLSTNNVLLGLNVFKEGMALDDLLSMLREFGMHKIRLSLAIPNGVNRQAHRKQYDTMKAELFRIFRAFAEEDVLPVFDCSRIPMCYYSQDEIALLKSLFKTRLRDTNLLTASTACRPVLDIYPDLTVCRCFGYTELHVNLLDFRNTEDLSNYFFNKVDKYRFDGPRPECKTCYLNSTMNCMGGCMAYKTEGESA